MLSLAILGAVLLTGMLGGVHCAGMCGGIVAALSGQVPAGTRRWPLHLSYNLGRITSYSVAGAAAGAIGSLGLLLDGMLPVQLALYVLANLLLIALGLYLAGISSALARLEPIGVALWRRVQPLTRRFLPASTVPRAFGLGVLWGWLPCGLVYSVLAMALLSGDALTGSAIMFAFGLGTLPNLMAAGLLLRQFRSLGAAKPVRVVSGALVLGFGVYGLANAATLSAHIKAGILCFG
jgi:sulfite exporter TauE/SafE